MFGEEVENYRELKISVIPLKGKRPIIGDWTRFSSENPNSLEYDYWKNAYAFANIGVVCGKASNVIGVDIDSDDDQLVNLILKAIPESPVAKKGKKGITLFYSFLDIPSTSIRYDGIQYVDILSTGRQSVLPPAIHPDTGEAYIWIGKPLYEVESLPIIPENIYSIIYDVIVSYCKKIKKEPETKGKVLTGRTNALKNICVSMICRREDPNTIIRELVEHDLKHHSPPLFEDPTESICLSDPFTNATVFYSSILKSINKNTKETNVPYVFSNSEEKQQEKKELVKEPEFACMPGIAENIVDHILKTAHVPNRNLAIAASISFLSFIASNRFCYGKTFPNLYVLSVAPSGAGKDRPQKVIQEIMIDLKMSDKIGSSSYTSDAALVANLPTTRERLDMLDEVGGLLKVANADHSSFFHARMSDTWAELWSSSSGYYRGRTSKKDGLEGACFNPCVNILASTTPQGFSEGVSTESFEKGFLSRFLIIRTGRNSARMLTELSDCYNLIITKLENFCNEYRVAYNGNLGKKPVPIILSSTPNFKDYSRLCFDRLEKLRLTEPTESILLPVLNRAWEQCLRLSVTSCVSRMIEQGIILSLDLNDLEWAFEFVTTYIIDMRYFLKFYADDSNFGKIYRFIRNAGNTGVKLQNIGLRFKKISAKDRKEILRDLIEMELVYCDSKVFGDSKKMTEKYFAKV